VANQVKLDICWYFDRDSPAGKTISYLKQEEFMAMRQACAHAITALYHPLALQRAGCTPEQIQEAREMSRHVLLSALTELGCSMFVPSVCIDAPRSTEKQPNSVTDNFDDVFEFH
jgi:hypothetical protein